MRALGVVAVLWALGSCRGAVGEARAGDATPADAAAGNGDALSGDGAALVFAWRTIPDWTFNLGIPVQVSLRAYLDDPSGAAVITLAPAPPAGLSFAGGTLSGTPTAVSASQSYVATADDGSGPIDSAPFSITVVAPALDLRLERATPEQIGLYLPLAVPLPAATRATVRYRPAGGGAWVEAHPLLRIHPEWIAGGAPRAPTDAFAGTIFDLAPGSAYDVEVTVSPPAADPVVVQTVASTRALPPAAGAATATVSSAAALQAALDALVPGDVLELGAGTYEVSGLQLRVSGTAEQPIIIRGASRDAVVLRSATRVLQVLQAAHVVIEQLTMEGAGVDSGTDASSVAVSFWDGADPVAITFRDLVIRGVDMGIIGWGALRDVLVYDCRLTGNNQWNAAFVESNLTWNDDGIRLPGEGNCAFNNTLHGFGDSFAVTNGVFSAAVHFYRNRVTMGGDDGFEGDYGTRNLGFYDNQLANVSTLLSLDPLWGGPLYAFRNVALNTVRGPFKLNNENSGFVIYNNTIVRTDGTTDWGWVQYDNGALRNFSFRNNLLVYHGGASLMALESSGIDPVDFDHNGWHPDGAVWWSHSGGSFGSLAAAQAGLPATTPVFGAETARHAGDLIVPAEPFADPVPLGADHLTEVTAPFWPALAAGSPAAGAGVAIANVTDGHAGAAPDLGAVITGRAAPVVGAR